MATYPTSIPDLPALVVQGMPIENMTTIAVEIVASMTALGANPQGSSGTVANRFAAIESGIAAANWTITGTALQPTDTTKSIQINATDPTSIRYGGSTVKARFIKPTTTTAIFPSANLPCTYWTQNLVPNATGSAWTSDDASKFSAYIQMGSGVGSGVGNGLEIGFCPVGLPNSLLKRLWLISNGDFAISGSYAEKLSGTTWANPSDRRIKKNVVDYYGGLTEVCALRPVSFEYNGLASTTDGQIGYGFIADEVATVMPETVTTRSVKLQPDDPDPVDLQTLDQSNMILALINAVKTLEARIAVLEAA